MNTCLASEMLQSKLAATCVFDNAVFLLIDSARLIRIELQRQDRKQRESAC